MTGLLSELADIVGFGHVLTGANATAAYCVDWSGRFRGSTPAVVRPGTTAEVAEVVLLCRHHGVALVPQGGNTGLVGGSVPLAGELVLSLGRLTAGPVVDAQEGRATVGAGVTLAALQAAAESAGWAYGVDFASRNTATVGGSIATNAGGLRVVRYGDTRAQLLSVEAVLGGGSVVSGLAGYDLAALLCGSEGTLGIVTAATVRLVRRADERVVALAGFDSVAAAVSAAARLPHEAPTVEAVELFLSDGLDLVCRVAHLPPPFPSRHAAYLLIEGADLAAAIARLPSVTVATEPADRAQLWAYRELHSQAVNTLGPPHKLDVAVPVGRLAELLDEVPAAVAAVAPTSRTWLWSHAAVGTVHVNVTGAAPDDDRVAGAVLRLAIDLGGSISAEHGIGTAKRKWLALSRSQAEIDASRALKRALDPDGILNPNVLLPAPPRGTSA